MLLSDDESAMPERSVAEPVCACGCEQPAIRGRNFVNQQHYDR
jgi:hypothetical protein